MKVPANQTTVDTITQYEKIVRFSNQELKLTVNGEVVNFLYFEDDTMKVMANDERREIDLDHDGMFDLVVERVTTQDITNLMFW